MKKIFTLVAAALMTIGAHAQDGLADGNIKHTFYTEVEPNTYAVTTIIEDVTAAFGEDAVTAAWGMGVWLPADYTLIDNDKLTMTTAVAQTPIYFSGNKIGDIQKEFPAYKGYMNLGSSLGQNNWKDNDIQNIVEATQLKSQHQGIFAVVPKVDGKLSFGVYAGDNSREIGIIDLPTLDEIMDNILPSAVNVNNFRNDGLNGTVKNAAAYVEGDVKAGRTYLLVGGGQANLSMHQVKFVPETSTGIENVENAEAAKVAPKKVFKNGQIMIGDFNIAGQRVK